MSFHKDHLERQNVLLLIAAGAEPNFPLDPIRIMKGSFLVSQRGPSPMKDLFRFRPYDYGPFDSDVYRAKDALVEQGYLAEDKSTRHGSVSITPLGRKRAEELRRIVGSKNTAWLGNVGKYVTTRSFETLLNEVYAAYPDFATKSRYSGARQATSH